MNEISIFELYSEIMITAAAVLIFLIFLLKVFPRFKNVFGRLFETIIRKPEIKDKSLEELIDNLGYAYDGRQDIFYSGLNTWQRDMGYCRLYDEAATRTNQKWKKAVQKKSCSLVADWV